MATQADEEADAWMEYLQACRDAKLKRGRYDELESRAWARLRARLHALELRREKNLVAA
jgi:hypothetical protein